MIILHAGILDGTLTLWGETPADEDAPALSRPGRRPKKPKPRSYKFDPGVDGLWAAFEEIPADLRSSDQVKAAAWLPSRGDHPLPSGSLIGGEPETRAKLRLAPWIVTAWLLPFETAADLLCHCMDERTLAPGLIVGRDLSFWTDAFRFSGSLVARQRYLPGLSREGEGYIARWEPVLTGQDARRVSSLAEDMPSPCRALTDLDATSAPEKPAPEFMREFLTEMVDHLVRDGCQEADLIEDTGKSGAHESVHDAWLHALRAPDGRLEWEEESEIEELAGHLLEWHRPVAVQASSPVRLCFRLEEPAVEEADGIVESPEGWYVRYLLQPHDDRSLLVPVEDIWEDENDLPRLLERYEGDIGHYVLTALGRAAELCPEITGSLETVRPAGFEVDTEGAHTFLTEWASALRQAGFGVMLPSWWTGDGTKNRLSTRAQVRSPDMQANSGLSLQQMADVRWEVVLGDEKLSEEELEQLAELKAPLVRTRGRWVELNPEEIESAKRLWKEREGEAIPAQEALLMALGAEEPDTELEFEGVEATGWIGDLLGELKDGTQLEEKPAPEGFSGTLRPYQVRGYSWLHFLSRWGLGACLADDMGLGKTIQALSLIQQDREQGITRPVLVVCPTSVVTNWKREAERFTPSLPVLVHHGSDRDKETAFQEKAADMGLIISSYGLLHRDVDFLRDISWRGVILDEAQKIKNPQTKRAQAARSLEADYRLALTGTPVENHVGELWSLMEFLNPGFLGSHSEFKKKFFRPIQSKGDDEAAQRLRNITGPFILRREKTNPSVISDLPEKMEMKVHCSLTEEQASLYAAVLKEMEEDLSSAEGIGRKGAILATLTKLKQVCNHPTQLLSDNSRIPGRSGKVSRLTDMLEEVLDVDDRALIFTQFTEMGDMLQEHLQASFGREVPFLHGSVSKKKRDGMVETFQEEDGPPIFILSLRAGGTGLNLTAANHVFHFDRWWNPAVEDQATDRAFRIGQEKDVQVHKFLCTGTLEERIDQMIEQKKDVADSVVGEGEAWLTELSDDRLKEVFELREDALAE